MATIEIQVPDIGDFDEVTVIELMVKAGDTVRAEQSLITVESDKASMEIPSSSAGVVKEVKVALGDKVKQGSLVLLLEVAGSASAAVASAPVAAAVAATVAVAAAFAPASPSVVEMRIPDIGDFKDVTVIELLVKPGDAVAAEQSLITVESDKASMEIPAPAAGVVQSLAVKLGDKVNIGDLVGISPSNCRARRRRTCTCGSPAVRERLRHSTGPHTRSLGVGYAARVALGAQICARTRRAARRSQRAGGQRPYYARGRARLHQSGDGGRSPNQSPGDQRA